MSKGARRFRGIKVLKAISSPLRLKILNFLFDKGSLSYTELMIALKMNPSRDAGKFAYHLKFLLKADLVEADAGSKKYFLSDLGTMVIDIAEKVEKRAFSQKEMLVRTSHFTLEEFDLSKISKSIIKEAKVPPDIAQKIAKETEKRLRKSKAKYITAPLVREIVNTILVEKGYENYRHKLTRMGMPVYEVTELLTSKKIKKDSTGLILEAGKKVFEEYVLLNIFPRDIADEHLSGSIHIEDLGSWILKPKEIFHDIRFFYECGLNLPKITDVSIGPAKNLDLALTITLNALLYCKKEISSIQTLESFNVFLSPFVQGRNIKKIKNRLRRFLINVSQNVNTTISLNLSIPDAIANAKIIGPEEESHKTYLDLTKESQILALLTLEIIEEESSTKPLFNPKIILKFSAESFKDKNKLTILRKAHNLAYENGNIYFQSVKNKKIWSVFSASGIKLSNDLSGDWETDTLRTGCLGIVSLNLPRIVQESENDKGTFFEILKERCELSARALKIKFNSIKQIGKISLPFMTQKTKGDAYFRFDQCSRIINFVGFQEAVEKFSGQNIKHEDSKKFAVEVVKNVLKFKRKIGRKYGKRFFPVILPNKVASRRLAFLDIEKFGVAKVRFSGTRYKPFFSTSKRLELEFEPVSIKSDSLNVENAICDLNTGGVLYIIDLLDSKFDYEELLKVTKNLIKNNWIEFFTYNRVISFCENCQKNWQKFIQKCPSCGSLSTMKNFDRFQYT